MINIDEYKFKYETHLHTKEGSACARNSGTEMAKAAKEAGYDGIFVTNHAWGGNTSVDRSLPWDEWVRAFAVGYEDALAWGKENNLTVMFGYESGYQGTEFLIYGISPQYLIEHPQFHDADIKTQFDLVHEGGGIVVHAHPYREEYYIPEIRLFPEYVDGVEAVNATHSYHLSKAHNNPEFDVKAIEYAKEHHFPMSAGSDVHTIEMLHGGVLTNRPIKCAQDYVELLLSDEMYLLTDGDRIYDRYGTILKDTIIR